MTLGTTNEALAGRYDDVPYAALPHPLTTPDRLATVATVLGLASPAVATARVLEVGCADGANLIPMAAALPGARFVGCDLSARALDAGRRVADAVGLANVTLVEEDLATLSPAHGEFDYVIAHGVYSWVRPEVRDRLFALARERLAPNGVMYVSFNALPGSALRQAAWDVLHYATDAVAGTRERLDAARRIARLVADGAPSIHEGDDGLRAVFRTLAQKSDSELCHDDLAIPNDPVYFHAFAAHAGRFGLRHLGDVHLHTMSAAGIGADARAFLGTLDPLAREQYLDFVRLRRFRQSLLCRADAPVARALDPARVTEMHVAAEPSLLRAAEADEVGDLARGLDPGGHGAGPVRRMLEALVAHAPGSRPVAEIEAEGAGAWARPLASILVDAFVADIVTLRTHPPQLTTRVGPTPRASALARFDAATRDVVTNQLHQQLRLPDPNARRLLALLDGTRDHGALARAMVDPANRLDATNAPLFVDHALAQFARLALLVA